MKTTTSQWTTNGSQPAHARMTTELRQAIRDGTVKPGSKVPTEPELAKQYGISVTSVRRGVEILVRERLVERKQGSGTYVLDVQAVPRPGGARDTVALALPLELCVYHPFFSEVAKGLRRQLGVHNWKLHDVQFARRGGAPHDIAALPVDAEAVLTELLRVEELAGGIFGADLIRLLTPRLPAGFTAIAVDPTDVCPYASYDWTYETLRGLDLLESQGARKIWVCGGSQPDKTDGPGHASRRAEALWYRRQGGGSTLLSEVTRDAYEAACAVLSTDKTIDGILAGDDYAAQGILDAIVKCGVEVPGKVKVVAQVNRASRLALRVPVTTLVADGYLKGLALADLLHEHLTSPLTAPRRVQLTCSVEYR
jgi:DNA-binding LacI/PurR family transcriptional regulator